MEVNKAATQLSAEALALCARNYGKVGSGCGRCPIQSACHAPIAYLSAETLDTWRTNINAAVSKAEAGNDLNSRTESLRDAP